MSGASSAISDAERISIRIRLSTGGVIEFTCKEFTTHIDGVDLQGYAFKGATGDVPEWIDLHHIVAITHEVKR